MKSWSSRAVALACLAAGLLACSSPCRDSDGPDADTGHETDEDSGSDIGTDTDIDSDSESDTDSLIDTDTGSDVQWIALSGGTYEMGEGDHIDDAPPHAVVVSGFDMAKTETTKGQYAVCVDAGICSEPNADAPGCTWGVEGQFKRPVNCVTWQQAVDFCTWLGGRLPSEAEWEFAARGHGVWNKFPWGWDDADCGRAVMIDAGGYGCGANRTWDVCSKPAGNSADGLCDMAGNAYEWNQDWHHLGYDGAPSDGSAWEDPPGTERVVRGGSFDTFEYHLRTYTRYRYDPEADNAFHVGFRCAR